MIGLCFGGGQLWLGGGVLGYLILHGLDRLERRLRRERPVELNLKWRQDAFDAGAALAAAERARQATMSSGTLRIGLALRAPEPVPD